MTVINEETQDGIYCTVSLFQFKMLYYAHVQVNTYILDFYYNMFTSFNVQKTLYFFILFVLEPSSDLRD